MKHTKRFTTLIPVLLTGLVIAAPLTYGRGSFPGTWSGTYPNSVSDNNAAAAGSVCWLCHTPEGTNTWNAYGNAIKRELDAGANDLAEALAAVEDLNSDGDPAQPPTLPDGWTNLQEITYGGQPGWTSGSQPYYDADGISLGTISPPDGMVSLDPETAVDTAPATWGSLKSRFRD